MLTGVGGAFVLSGKQQDSPASPAASLSDPPWIYGKRDARFTLVAFADFECPYCQTTIPQLLRWVQENPEVTLQWHHLPFAAHEPVASREARLAECQGEVGGTKAFWETVLWIYQHTRGNGQGLAAMAKPPGLSRAVQTCLESERPAAIVRAQADEAAADGIAATPTLLLRDRETGRTLRLEGAVDDDVLLSALDWLSVPPETVSSIEGSTAR